MPNNHTQNPDDELIIISKSEQKRSVQKMEAMGAALIKLNNKQLEGLPLDDLLREAIDTAKRIKVGNALNRQMRYIGKLIRKMDYEAIEAAINLMHQEGNVHEKITYQAEQWRDTLIENGSEASSTFIDAFPLGNRQKLNQLIRAAIKEQSSSNSQKQPTNKQRKLLFTYIRQILSESR